MKTENVFKPWVVYKADRKTKEITKPFFYENKPDIKKILQLEGHKFFFFFYNKNTDCWAVPQICNEKNETIKKEIAICFKKIKLATTVAVMKAVFPKLIMERCKLEMKIVKVKEDNLAFFKRKAEYSQKIKDNEQKAALQRLGTRYKVRSVEKTTR